MEIPGRGRGWGWGVQSKIAQGIQSGGSTLLITPNETNEREECKNDNVIRVHPQIELDNQQLIFQTNLTTCIRRYKTASPS